MKRRFTISVIALIAFTINLKAQYFTEGFENGVMPTDWHVEYETGDNADWIFVTGPYYSGEIAPYEGSYMSRFYEYQAGGAITKLVTGAIDISGATSPQLNFRHIQQAWSASEQEELRIYYKTSPASGWALVPGGEWTSEITSWTQQTIDLPEPSATYYIAFEGVFNNGKGIFIDDISIDEPITCPKPTGFTASNMSANTVDLNWTENGTATVWNVEYGPSGFTQGTGTTISLTSNPATINTLNSATLYDIYIQADCGGDYSYWTNPIAFETECDPIVVNTSWIEDFESEVAIPICWKNETTNDYDWEVLPTDQYNGDHTTGAGNYAKFDAFIGAEVGDVGELSSPILDITPLANPILRFYWKRQTSVWNDDRLEIDIHANGTWNNDAVPGLLETDYLWEEVIVYLPQYVASDFRIRLRTIGGDHSIIIDDIVVEEGPTCAPPTNLHVSGLTASSANLGWTENGSATAWNIEYGINGFTQGTGTTISATSNPFTISSGLIGSFTYQYYVQADCGGEQSEWVGPFSFTTECYANTTFPWSEDFENAGGIPSCWKNELTNGYDWEFQNYIYTNGFIADGHGDTQNGDQYFAVFDTDGSTEGDVGELTTIPLDLTVTWNPELHFWWNKPRFSGVDQVTFEIDVFADGVWHTDIYPEIDDVDTTNLLTWEEAVISMLPYKNSDFVQIRFRVTEHNWNASIIGLDDVSIVEGPTCIEPSGLAVSNATLTEADINWTENGDATAWIVSWGSPDFTPGTQNLQMVNATNYTLTGLDASTAYEVYVQAHCGGSDFSEWIGPISFSTTCSMVTSFPWVESFDGIWACWEIVDNDNDNYSWSYEDNLPSWVSSMTTHSGSSLAYISPIAGSDRDQDDYLISPQLKLDAPYALEWYDRSDSLYSWGQNFTYEVLVSTTTPDISNFTINLGTFTQADTLWVLNAVDLSSFTGQNIYIAFHLLHTSTMHTFGIDDVYVGPETALNTNHLQSKTNIEALVYPNPNQGTFNVLVNNKKEELVHISIVDTHGKVIHSSNSNTTSYHELIDITNYSKGIYFLRINSESYHKVEKIVLQ